MKVLFCMVFINKFKQLSKKWKHFVNSNNCFLVYIYLVINISARKGSRCVVPNCKSGYASCKEKATLISAPKDEETVKKWESAIPRKSFTLKSGQVVCQKHFTWDDIAWKKEVKDPEGNVMASVSKCFDL